MKVRVRTLHSPLGCTIAGAYQYLVFHARTNVSKEAKISCKTLSLGIMVEETSLGRFFAILYLYMNLS